jgi:hypothetical protein
MYSSYLLIILALVLVALQAWLDKSRVERDWKTKESGACLSPGLDVYKKQKQLRTRLSKIVTIDSVYEKKFISIDAVLEVVILGIQLLPGASSTSNKHQYNPC